MSLFKYYMKLDESIIDLNTNYYDRNSTPFLAYQSNNYIQLQKENKAKNKKRYNNPDMYNITNQDISYQFGQYFYDKALLVISIIFSLNTIIFVSFISEFNTLFKVVNFVSIGIQTILIIIYLYIYFVIRKAFSLYGNIPFNLIRFVKILTIVYALSSFTSVIFLQFQKINYLTFCYILYFTKIFVDIYYIAHILRTFSFLHNSYRIQCFFKRIWFYISFYILCLEEEDYNNNYYEINQEYDEFDSEY